MKITFITIFFMLWGAYGFCQTNVSGVVTDVTGLPVPYATIQLKSLRDSSAVRNAIADSNGKYFLAQLAPGEYLIRISVVGYAEKNEPVSVEPKTRDLQVDLVVSPRTEMLNAVSISAVRDVIELKNGNIVVNVENSALAKGNSLYDLLLKLPGVSVDNNNRIMVQGKTGVVVMIDDRPQRLTEEALINLLRSMNADMVSSVEVLKNPPVKYDATGTSGMINIKSKKVGQSGFSGSVFSSFSKGIYNRSMPGASLNYKSKKVAVYSKVGAEKGYYQREQRFNKRFSSGESATILDTDMTNKDGASTLNYAGGVDWMPTKSDIFGVKIEGSAGNNKIRGRGRNTVSGYNTMGFDYMDIAADQNDRWTSNNYNFNYERKMDTLGSSLTLVTDYTDLDQDLANDNKNIFYNSERVAVLPPNNYRSNNDNTSNIFSVRSDLVKVLDSISSLELGVKAVIVNSDNDYLFERDYTYNGQYSEDSGVSNYFKYREITYAGYFNYIRSLGKVKMNLGARLEKTYLEGHSAQGNYSVNKDYFQVFPNVSFEYAQNESHNFQLNLLRRTNRPNFSDLNPFMLFLDQYSFRQGNPFLFPDFTNRGELTYSFRGALSTSIAYSYTDNVMMQYISQNDAEKTSIQSIRNMRSNQNLEYSMFYQNAVSKVWSVSASGSFFYMDYRGDIDGIAFHERGVGYYGNLSNTFVVAKNAKLEMNGLYVGPNVYGIVRVKPRWMASLALKVSLYKNALDATLGVDDIFYTFINRVETHYLNQNWYSVANNDTRRVRISLSYKIGKMKPSRPSTKYSNKEEKVRLGH